ncbi:alpha/beta hydrolase [Amycolatopsis minnesotensis]|uniref:Alpha/beta hydrolase n=1 Tax=Amycolatopsis minnesotensis TaxID=337894 RepID=A0ABP5BIC7_9PSEU
MTKLFGAGAGRVIAVEEFGDPGGVPWLYFHGTNSAGAEGRLFDGAARYRGVRVLAADRPGIGGSTPGPGHDILDWARDVTAVADALGLDGFVVGGWSSGAAHAMACAYALPRRVRGGVLVNTATPEGAPGPDRRQRAIAGLARRMPWLVRRVVAPLMTKALSRPERVRDPAARARILRYFPAVDRPLLAELWSTVDGQETFMAMAREAARQGSAATARDLLVLWGRQGWGFTPSEISVPLRLFTGERDSSRQFAEALADIAPDASVHLFPGGHHGFLAGQAQREICDAVVTAWECPRTPS